MHTAGVLTCRMMVLHNAQQKPPDGSVSINAVEVRSPGLRLNHSASGATRIDLPRLARRFKVGRLTRSSSAIHIYLALVKFKI